LHAGEGDLVKLGVNILNFGPGTSPDSLRAWAQLAEHAGFSIAMISDHVALRGVNATPGRV
jgi:alkanesulfonate monooxygenase SsuD/methylene tetrahydromethanopterin reductase-like flavin-dependent oxidoreductase (luciferase family)